MSPGLISAAIGLLTLVFAIGGAWAVVQYKFKVIEAQQKTFSAAIDSLKDTIREEFDRAINRINKLLFEEGGITRYTPRPECRTSRADLLRRIERLEEKLP
jgi:hypothetical protein